MDRTHYFEMGQLIIECIGLVFIISIAAALNRLTAHHELFLPEGAELAVEMQHVELSNGKTILVHVVEHA